jgi:hypothetical protein
MEQRVPRKGFCLRTCVGDIAPNPNGFREMHLELGQSLDLLRFFLFKTGPTIATGRPDMAWESNSACLSCREASRSAAAGSSSLGSRTPRGVSAAASVSGTGNCVMSGSDAVDDVDVGDVVVGIGGTGGLPVGVVGCIVTSAVGGDVVCGGGAVIGCIVPSDSGPVRRVCFGARSTGVDGLGGGALVCVVGC